MNTILNAKEAFEALQNRKTVLCRYAGNGTLPGDKDFSSLDQMPATVFVMPHYEFCIKIETMELAGITFTKPLVPEDIRDQQEIYIVMPTCILCTKYDAEHTDVHNAVMNGFAQADADNALLQLKALGAVFGNAIESVEVKDGFEEKPKRQRKQRETKITVVDDKDQVPNETSLNPENNKLGVGEPSSEQTSEDFESILNDLIERASTAQSPAEANALFKYTKGWTQEQSAPLHAAVSRRLAELPQPEAKEPPSLLIRIKNAPDLTELDALEIDVSGRDERIQPTLMAEVYKRRKQLEAPINLIDEAFP